MVQHILVPLDGSENSRNALDFAMETFPDAELTLLNVLEYGKGDIGTFSGMTGDLPDDASAEELAEEVLNDARQHAEDAGFTVHTEQGTGRPDRLITRKAENGEYDIIVMGSHGRSGVSRVLLGSVAEKVVRRSPIPVMVYR